MLSAIVAMAHERVIGSQNDLPWYLPADLKHFKELTTGHPVIMGRKTAASILARLGHGLPKRENIVISRDPSYKPEGFIVTGSVQEALARVSLQDAFVIGGAQIYAQTLPHLDRLEITEVDADIPGDTYFPTINPDEWQEAARETHMADEKNPYAYSFVTLVKP